jgi:hypothetical protein
MNNYEEIIDALKAGETLINVSFQKIKLEHGSIVDEKGNILLASMPKFNNPSIWQIYKEPKWYENIPDGGVLCVCGTSKSIRLIESFVLEPSPSSNSMPVFRTKDYDEGDWWYLCRPATLQEIQVFMDNAPEK